MSAVRRRLFTPGPTELPDAVYAALATPLAPARSQAFEAVLAAVTTRLREAFRTAGAVVTLTASGTGAMEAAYANLVRRDDVVLVAHAGKFGERWVEIARAFGSRVRELSRPWGEPIRPADLAAALDHGPPPAVVLLTHSETSTGVAHDVEALAAQVRARGDALVVVDGVSSVGVLPLHMDRWGIDACVAASHKGLLCPPGLAFVALSERAQARVAGADLPRFYFDLRPAIAGLSAGGTPWTPAISLVHALDAGLRVLLDGGIEAAWMRTARLARGTRAGARGAGLGLFAHPPGDALTALTTPPGLDARRVVAGLRERGFEVAAGQGPIKRDVFRIAHMGTLAERDLLDLMDALEATLSALGAARTPAGAARAAAAAALAANPP